jgi:hypothetical protein
MDKSDNKLQDVDLNPVESDNPDGSDWVDVKKPEEKSALPGVSPTTTWAGVVNSANTKVR